MSTTPGSLGQAVGSLSQAYFQMWFLPWKICETVRGASILRSTLFSVETPPDAGSVHHLSLEGPLTPGIPYAKQDEQVPISAIRFEPASLGPGEAQFRLVIRGDALRHLPGATYRSTAVAKDAASGQQVGQPVAVWLVVS